MSEQFMQWFLKEQVEEIDLMSTLLDTAERSRERPLDIEDFIVREGVGGGEDADPSAPPGRRWLTSSCSPWPRGARRWTRWRSGWRASSPRPRESLDLALYDVRLPAPPVTWWRGAAGRGRAAGWPCASPTTRTAARTSSLPPPSTKPELIEALPFPTKAIPGIPDLMHHKYVVRDGERGVDRLHQLDHRLLDDPGERGGRGSLADLAGAFTRNFEELWPTRDVSAAGARSRARVRGRRRRGARLVHAGAGRGPLAPDRRGIGRARRRVRIASPVLTAGPVIGTLAEVAGGGEVDLRGWSTARR